MVQFSLMVKKVRVMVSGSEPDIGHRGYWWVEADGWCCVVVSSDEVSMGCNEKWKKKDER